ncbi:tape measure protein [Spirosoma linguale]|uniref:Phage tape measure protein n=1 Tax=Spirosoma linguale (strain ATCC 33905 / DSM 74 / LMG 10896 / Claus 1) TaxID=504472 RepID=D2QNB1_SPILD|nr:phage tape measure protein [Spirosoma linguale DSM 74]
MTENLQAVFTLNDSAFARGTDRILDALSRIEAGGIRTGNRLENSFNSPLKSITNLVGGFFAVDKAMGLLKQGLQITSDFERLDAGLNAVSTSSIDFARSQLYLRELSDRLGISYETLASSYRGLKAATNGTVLEGKATEKIFTSVVQAGAALKLSNDEVKGSLLAISQMMSKGTVSAEELRGQLGERLPGAFKLMADALHVSEQELNKMLQTGSVMAADALPKLAAELEKVYGSKALANANSMAGGWTRATDQLKLFTAEFSKENGIDSFFAKLGNGVANYINLLRRAKAETGSYTGTVVTDPTAIKQKEIFAKYSTAEKQNYIGYLARQIRTAEGRSDALAALDPTEENSKKSIAFENYIKSMRSKMATYRKMLNEEYAENERQAKATASKVSDPIALLEKAKDRFKYLTDLKAGLALQGKNLSSGQATELAKLTKQLQYAGVKKVAGTTGKTDFSVLSHLETIRKFLDSDLQKQRSLTGFVSPETAHELDNVLTQIKRIKGEVEKPATLKIKGTGLLKENLQSENDRQGRLRSPLFDRLSEPARYRTLGFYNDEIDKIKSKIATLSLKNLAIPKTAIDTLKDYTSQLDKADLAVSKVLKLLDRQRNINAGKSLVSDVQNQTPDEKWNSVGGISSNWGDTALENLTKYREQLITNAQEMTGALQNVLIQGASGATAAMGALVDGLIEGTKGIEDLPGVILGVVADTLRNLAKTLAASGAALMFVPGFQLEAGAQLAGAVGLYAAAGLAQSAAQPKRKQMAKGGTLSGPTDITAGEYPGASRRPEWVSPVDVGADLIAERIAKRGGMGGMSGTVVFEIAADKLRGVLQHGQRSLLSLG